MLGMEWFRNDDLFQKVLESERKRNKSTEFAENTRKYDVLWRKSKQEVEELRAKRNKLAKKAAELAKKRQSIESIRTEMKEIEEKIKSLEEKMKEYLKLRDDNRYKVGNILYPDVPYGKSDEDNVPLWFWGKAKVQKKHLDSFKAQSLGKMDYELLTFEPKSHADLGVERDLFDLERAAKVAGARFYYLKGKLAILHLALMRFAIDFLTKKGYSFLYTPYMIRREVIEKAAELADFEETLYKVGDEHFLIATAEQTLASYHMDEVLKKDELPKKYVGFSACFRREAGSHGKDTRGIFRVHQFDKVEQYVFCTAEENEKMHKEMISNAEEIIRALELPYRVINICSGDMNDTAAKKYDIETWMPVQGKFREMVSGSITTDYQTRKLNIKYEEKGEKKYVHSLNCTAIASPRILAAIIENHQTADGTIKVPKALWQYTGFKEI